MNEPQSILSLDVGTVRIGVARASTIAKLPEALDAILVDGAELTMIKSYIDQYSVDAIVLGLPQNLAGRDTQQTALVRKFAEQLKELGIPLYWQNEELTSVRAEAELNERKKQYNKGEVDSLAAVYILEDYLKENA